MIWRVLMLAACAALVGCGAREAAAPPTPNPMNPPAQQPAQRDLERARIVEKVGNVDYAAYGFPIFPGAQVNKDVTLAYRADKTHPRQITVTLDSTGSVREIADWYKDQIKATSAYASVDLGTLEGTTDMGYPIKVSIAKVDTKSVIVLTVDDNPKK